MASQHRRSPSISEYRPFLSRPADVSSKARPRSSTFSASGTLRNIASCFSRHQPSILASSATIFDTQHRYTSGDEENLKSQIVGGKLNSPIEQSQQLLKPPLNNPTYPLPFSKHLKLQYEDESYNLLQAVFDSDIPTHAKLDRRAHLKVLDLGCGEGRFAVEMARVYKNSVIIALDISNSDTIAQNYGITDEKLLGRIKYVHSDFLQSPLPFSNQTFDYIRMCDLGLCIPKGDWEPLIREAHRVLKSYGQLEIITEDIFAPQVPGMSTQAQDVHLEREFEDFLFSRGLHLYVRGLSDILHTVFSDEKWSSNPINGTIKIALPLIQRPSLPKDLALGSQASSFLLEGDSLDSRSHSAVNFSYGKFDKRFSIADSISSDGSSFDDSAIFPTMSLYPNGLLYELSHGDTLRKGYLPMEIDEIIAHSTRNLHIVTAAKEAIWNSRIQEMKDDNHRSKFEEAYWDYEEGIRERFGFPSISALENNEYEEMSNEAHQFLSCQLSHHLEIEQAMTAPQALVRRLHTWIVSKLPTNPASVDDQVK